MAKVIGSGMAEHRRQPTPVFRIRQEFSEVMSLKGLDEKEAQGSYTIHRCAGRQLAFFKQIRW
jgi:hypothetical protein